MIKKLIVAGASGYLFVVVLLSGIPWAGGISSPVGPREPEETTADVEGRR